MDQQNIPELHEGDIFYTQYDGKYHVYKLLRKDKEAETFHVLGYAPLDDEPDLSKLSEFEVSFYHAPIHQESFTDTILLINTAVTEDELIGYYEYQKQTDNEFEQIANKATAYYQQAYLLTDEGKYEEAIALYSKAIELLPTFYEAIDNRAFCKMDLGRWRDAIEDFSLSLQVHADSLLAEFSIGECYYRLGEFSKARDQFEKCIKLDPTHQVSKDFLIKAEALIKSNNG
jgi:tetratricopeptide (TPR) repeat protein